MVHTVYRQYHGAVWVLYRSFEAATSRRAVYIVWSWSWSCTPRLECTPQYVALSCKRHWRHSFRWSLWLNLHHCQVPHDEAGLKRWNLQQVPGSEQLSLLPHAGASHCDEPQPHAPAVTIAAALGEGLQRHPRSNKYEAKAKLAGYNMKQHTCTQRKPGDQSIATQLAWLWCSFACRTAF